MQKLRLPIRVVRLKLRVRTKVKYAVRRHADAYRYQVVRKVRRVRPTVALVKRHALFGQMPKRAQQKVHLPMVRRLRRVNRKPIKHYEHRPVPPHLVKKLPPHRRVKKPLLNAQKVYDKVRVPFAKLRRVVVGR